MTTHLTPTPPLPHSGPNDGTSPYEGPPVCLNMADPQPFLSRVSIYLYPQHWRTRPISSFHAPVILANQLIPAVALTIQFLLLVLTYSTYII
jgi:hypothetical protein